MARLRLRQSETTCDQLPPICIVCGQPAVAHISKNFRWFPEWVGVLILAGLFPYWIMAAILSKYMMVEVPVCHRHRNYFRRRLLAISVITVVLFVVPALLAGVVLAGAQNPDERVTGIMVGIFSFVVGVVPAVIVIAVIQNTTVRPAEITDRAITLKRVHDEFVTAFGDLMRTRDFDDRPPRRRTREIEEVLPADDRETYRARREIDEPPRRRFRDDK